MPPTLDLTRREAPSLRSGSWPPAHASGPRRGRWVLGAALLGLVLSVSAILLVLTPGSAPAPGREGPILVVGDSLVVQATNALRAWNLPAVPIIVDGGVGSAPCDWANGYTDPVSGRYLKFSLLVQTIHPAAVVFAFTGNPGLEWQSAGCVNGTGSYTLPALLANYTRALTQMAREASAHGARVYFSASPPRNPLTPAGAYKGAGGTPEYGFNGVPAFNSLFDAIAASTQGRASHWAYDPDAAQFVSTSDLTWHLTESCLPWDGNMCMQGTVQVRAGGLDAIHLDANGAGATLYATGLVMMPLEQMTGWPSSLTFPPGNG